MIISTIDLQQKDGTKQYKDDATMKYDKVVRSEEFGFYSECFKYLDQFKLKVFAIKKHQKLLQKMNMLFIYNQPLKYRTVETPRPNELILPNGDAEAFPPSRLILKVQCTKHLDNRCQLKKTKNQRKPLSFYVMKKKESASSTK